MDPSPREEDDGGDVSYPGSLIDSHHCPIDRAPDFFCPVGTPLGVAKRSFAAAEGENGCGLLSRGSSNGGGTHPRRPLNPHCRPWATVTLRAPSAVGAPARKRRDAGSAAVQTISALGSSALAGP